MTTSNFSFDELFKKFSENMPKGLLEIQQDMEKNMRLTMETMLRNMNLVTREEFDVQVGVLQRTRARLEALEAKVVLLEAQLNGKNETPPSKTTPATDEEPTA